MEYYTAQGKKELLPFVTAWTELDSLNIFDSIVFSVPWELYFISNFSDRLFCNYMLYFYLSH